MVAKGRIWYLVAAIDGDIRTYRVSRVQDAYITDQACLRPDGFDLARYWAQSTVQFKQALPHYAATLRVHPEIVAQIHNPGRFATLMRSYPPDVDGWVKVEMQLDVEENACSYVLSFGPRIEVLAPPSLRVAVIEAAKALLEVYQAP